ncbi:aspartyl-phosphate phosphatase Spo0E family protein [Clostridium cellulovorans]|uniref:Sporulation stage 0, Spo0E-like regulatory phosphatase n=1 Tax=Clostridium cellulovorans (strain ATCC 35296 / DSM 3052 / OCM 3 / 743B) TaxID=573061 RepID=D9SKB8_CLOC7|nr:aspartyl-phosphate phosphatase Spo0E family protein [Clostridium cellulovorans]ADL51414.1 Sporulation stage 0, Spo0E-like regulatory phosphatase [Clostridium cellulovorans 743B]
MNLYLFSLRIKITYLKFLLNNKVKGKSPLTSDNVVALSQKLDKLIVDYQKTMYTTYKETTLKEAA